jgi:16S rRNA (guanine966-N2)-methyltransferase
VTRIIAGELGGRRIAVPADARVRPTADRVREAWMSILGPRLAGSSVLDLFAGSGALGFEALSRGAAHATMVDMNPAAVSAIRENARDLGVEDRVTVRRGDAMRYVRKLTLHAFDIALADPPYTIEYAGQLVAAFRDCAFARVLAVEHPATTVIEGGDTRRYGDIALTFCEGT